MALSILFSTPVKLSTKLLPAFFASSKAALNSPLNTFFIALPKKPTVSNIALNLFVIFSTNRFLKFIKACLGSSNTDIIPSPKSANRSNKFPVTLPITPSILANLFCPSSLRVKACVKDVIAIISAPIPVAIIAPLKVLKLAITPPKPPFNALNLLTAPPVALSTVLPIC